MFRRRSFAGEKIRYNIYINKSVYPYLVDIVADDKIIESGFSGDYKEIYLSKSPSTISVEGNFVSRPSTVNEEIVPNGITSGGLTFHFNSGTICGRLADSVNVIKTRTSYIPIRSISNPVPYSDLYFDYDIVNEVISSIYKHVYWNGICVDGNGCVDTNCCGSDGCYFTAIGQIDSGSFSVDIIIV